MDSTGFDTSPYYGDSETVMGHALHNFQSRHPRDSYILITKCGRKSFHEFDYSRTWIRQTVLRSLDRLRTSYLDVALLHDAEFASAEEVIEATSVLSQLRADGLVRAFGLSGYTLPVLLSHVKAVRTQLGPDRTPEVLFSYCHYTLQNNTLADYESQFRELGIRHIVNGSPLAMGLLRKEPAPDWHPASTELKAACMKASEYAEDTYDQRLADVALRYSLGWRGTTCAGCSSLEEVETLLEAWKIVKKRKREGITDCKDEEMFKELREILAEGRQVVWQMPPVGFVRSRNEK
jgi:D-arabinose 1-dehydrogenase